MTEFASRLNSPAEQRALLALIIDEFDAVEVPSSGWEKAQHYAGVFAVGSGTQWDPTRNTSETRLVPNAEAEARAALEEYAATRDVDEQLSLGDAA